MSMQELLARALDLDVDERAALAEQLLASLDGLSEDEADRLWAQEAEHRLTEYRAGRMQARSAEDVHARAEQLLSERHP